MIIALPGTKKVHVHAHIPCACLTAGLAATDRKWRAAQDRLKTVQEGAAMAEGALREASAQEELTQQGLREVRLREDFFREGKACPALMHG